ncbi:MAG: NAD-dependent epimerase/dehydratase family protein [Nitrospirae bacterium]|nr:NAD-dependent epimerase/dehydratase family protein [Nitrospirota bacterium]
MAKERVYVSGATGFIGSHTMRVLTERGYRVRISRRKSSKIENLAAHQNGVEILDGDLGDLAFAKECVKGCDGVIHLAGWVRMSVDPKLEQEVIRSNYQTTRNVFEACRAAGTPRVVFLGSIFGFGRGEGREAADETVQFNLEDLARKVPYVRAKKQCEEARDEFVGKGVPVVTVYPNFCFGEGDVYLSSSRAIVPYLKGQMSVYLDGGINVQGVDDAGASLVLGLEKGKAGEKYLSGGENLEYREMYRILESATGIKAPRRAVNPALLNIFYRLPRAALVPVERFLYSRLKLEMGMVLIAAKRYWYYSDAKIRRDLGYVSQPAPVVLGKAARWLQSHLRLSVS